MKWILTYGLLLASALSWTQLDGFKAGNDAYEASEYETAIEKYSAVISNGTHSAELYYNLGNAYYRNGEIGKAIWAYESALKIEPDHEDALFNLEFVNAQTVEKLESRRQGFGHWLQSLVFSSSINLWVWISIICSLSFSGMTFLFIRSKKKSLRNISLISSALFGFGLIISIWIGYQHKDYITSRSKGVVISEQVNVLVSPLKDAGTSYKLGEGARVNLVAEEKDWIQIELNGNKGWVEKKDVWEI